MKMSNAQENTAAIGTRHELSGSFTAAFAERKRWKLDPKLLAAIKYVLPPGCSVIDLGAGIGKTVLALREAGWEHTEGVDGIPGIDKLSNGLVLELDLTGRYVWHRLYADAPDAKQEDIGWRPGVAICIEVGEHIPADKQEWFLNNLADAARELLIVSYAVPGQRGRDHVSCRSPEWVANQLGKRSWELSEDITIMARSIAGKGWDKKLLVFKKTERENGGN